MNIPKIEHFCPNHVIIRTTEGSYFQSYDSIVAKRDMGKITLFSDWDYSRTTVKHLCRWLGYTPKELRQKIKEEKIIVEDV